MRATASTLMPVNAWSKFIICSAEKCAACTGLYSIDARARGRKEDTAVFAPRDVRGKLRHEDASEERAVGAAHPYAAGPTREDVARDVDLHAVRNAGFVRAQIENDAA